MALGDGTTWDVTAPTDATEAVQIDDYNRDLRAGVQGRMAIEHFWPASQAATNEAGLHRYISFQVQTGAPALVVGTNTQAGVVYVTSAGNALVFKNSAGTNVPMVNQFGIMAPPPGVIWPYGGSTAPTGFYLCNGTEVSRSTDAALFAAIGTIWGTGDNSTTFNVPDFQGFTIVGKSTGGMFATIASTTGELAHTLVTAEIPAIPLPAYTNAAFIAGGIKAVGEGGPASTNTINTATEHNNVQPSKVALFIIAR